MSFLKKNSGSRRLLDAAEEDPLSGVANLFDVSMVLMAALLLALTLAWKNSHAANPSDQAAEKAPLETVEKKGERLDRYRPTNKELGGEGQRLGIAYRLKNGEVVYVPEKTK